MAALSPQEAASIAKHVYTVRSESDMETAYQLSGGLGIRELFEVGNASRLVGSSGVLMFKKQSGFGYVAKGVGPRQGEALVALRGTATGRDWATDANIGLVRGPGGDLVHSGFNDTYRSFRDELQQFFARFSPSEVHCVGHSLGGALATLVADHLTENGFGVTLYTFGCPRVGSLLFSRNLTRKVAAERVYRVHHTADPVAMIPLFPYTHVPFAGSDCELPWNGGRIDASAHGMEQYLGSIGDAGWRALHRATPDVNWEQRARDWLRSASEGGVMMFSATAFQMITQAMAWLLRKILVGVVGTTLAVGVTILDQLAWLLHQGALASQRIAADVKTLMAAIFAFLGRTMRSGAEISIAFIRWTLNLLYSAVRNACHRAMSLISFG